MSTADELSGYAADPDGVILRAVLCAEPALGTDVVARVVAQVAPDRTRRRRLARGLQEDPGLLTSGRPQGPRIVGDLIAALRRAGAVRVVPAGCGSCGRQRPLPYIKGTVRICGTCGHRRFSRREVCSVCGVARSVARRDRQGRSQCAQCARRDDPDQYPATVLAHLVRLDTGLDEATLKEVLRQAAPKPFAVRRLTCELETVPSLLTGDGARGSAHLLTPAIPARHGLCETCAAPDRLRELLGDDRGIVAPGLEPVFRALAGGKPSSVLEWLNRPGRAALLSQIRNTGMPVTHGMLDQLAPADRTRMLRMILVATHVLPERDEQLAALERWVSQFLKNTTDPVERRLLHAFVTWHYLRRLRRKHHPGRPLSPHTAANVRYCLAQSAQFLKWLREHGAPLAACSQHDIDTWLAEGTVMRFKACGFVRWAACHNHIRRPVAFPPMPSAKPYRTLPDDADRWRLVHRFLHDDSIAAVDRVAGLLVLLYGQPLTKIAALTTDQVLITGVGIRLALGPHPVTVPPPLDQLLIHLAEDRDGALALGRSTDHSWLLPGTHPGRPRSPRQLRTRLASYGLPSRRGRNSALMDLAAQMPPRRPQRGPRRLHRSGHWLGRRRGWPPRPVRRRTQPTLQELIPSVAGTECRPP
ncbi:hypothetical protein [Streptomyces sp. YKOK-I1]